MAEVISSVAQRLGYSELKPGQHVKEFLSGKNTFVSFPTGYGKSYCYACLLWIFDLLKKAN